MAKSFLQSRHSYPRASYASGWQTFFGREQKPEAAAPPSMGSAAGASATGNWRSTFQNLSPAERLGLNLLARAFGGGRLNVLASILQAIPGFRAQEVSAPGVPVAEASPTAPKRRRGVRPPGAGGRFRRVSDSRPPETSGRGGSPPGGRFSRAMGEDPDDIPFGEIVEDEEIPFGEVVRRPPRRELEDGIINQVPGFNRIAPPTKEETRERRERARKQTDGAIYAGQFGHIEMFRPKSPSSNVYAIGYDPDERALFVQFMPTTLVHGIAKRRQATATNTGPVYQYTPVSQTEFDRALNASSPGKWVWDVLRIRGTRHGHKKAYSLAQEGRMWNRRGEEVEYVPRRATRDGLASREYLGTDRRMRRNTLPARDRRG